MREVTAHVAQPTPGRATLAAQAVGESPQRRSSRDGTDRCRESDALVAPEIARDAFALHHRGHYRSAQLRLGSLRMLSTSLREPVRYPSRSSATQRKPSGLIAALMRTAISGSSARDSSDGSISTRAMSPW